MFLCFDKAVTGRHCSDCRSGYLPVRLFQERVELLFEKQKQFDKGKFNTRSDLDDIHSVSDLVRSFNFMAEEIESKVKQRHIFAQAIPNGVCTPLIRIQLATDILRRRASEKLKVLFDDIDTYIEDINELTSEIITLSKLNVMDNSFFELVKVGAKLLEYCLDRICYSELDNVTFESNVKQDSAIKSDYSMARLVFDNTLKNAGNYTQDKVFLPFSRLDSR